MRLSLPALGAAAAASAAVISTSLAHAGQLAIPRIEQMPNLPSPLNERDWRATALAYDALVTDFFTTTGLAYRPLPWIDSTRINIPFDSVGLQSYIGSYAPHSGTAHEAINCIAETLGATLVGIDKSQSGGRDWVRQQECYYNTANGQNLVLNNVGATTGGSFWYEVFPQILFDSLSWHYPAVGNSATIMHDTSLKWRTAEAAMGGGLSSIPNFDHTAFNFLTMSPVDNGLWKEPDSAAGIAWIELMAHRRFGEAGFLEGADWGLQFLQARSTNPTYEVLMPYGAYAAARMNAEDGRSYDVPKFLGWCFSTSAARPGWGVIAETWGGLDAHGLCGSVTDGGGYAFTMNTFNQAAPLAPLVRYDDRFARAIGKWMLNASNAARLFYSTSLPAANQSSSGWNGDPAGCVAYEGLHKTKPGNAAITPYATGDALRSGWGATDYGLYGSSHVGVFGGIIAPTADPAILQLDLLKTDVFHGPAYPSYLYYNPHTATATVTIDAGPTPTDLYDTVSKTFLATGVSGSSVFYVPADSAAAVVLTPSGLPPTFAGKMTLVNSVAIDYHNDRTPSAFAPALPFAADADTIFLLRFDDGLIDSSPHGYPVAYSTLSGYTYPTIPGSMAGYGRKISADGGNVNGLIVNDTVPSTNYVGALTAEAWMKIPEARAGGAEFRNNILDLAGGRFFFSVRVGGGADLNVYPELNVYDGTRFQKNACTIRTAGGWSFGDWHHFAVTYDPAHTPVVEFFFDGVRQTKQTVGTDPPITSQFQTAAEKPLTAGRMWPPAAPTQNLLPLVGDLDEIRLSRVLRYPGATAARVQTWKDYD